MPKEKKPPHHKKKTQKRDSGRSKKPFNKRAQFEKNSGHLPETCVLLINGINEEGEPTAEPAVWSAHTRPPHIIVTESGRAQAVAKGDKILAKLKRIQPHLYQALVIRVLPSEAPRTVLGVLVATAEGGIIEPVSRKTKESFVVNAADLNGAEHGELVSAITLPGVPSMSMGFAKIAERLGQINSPKAASLIATHMHDLPTLFSPDALKEAEAADAPTMSEGRVDLRDIPLVTIDGADARDFDDAVFAERDGSGFHLVVAIADVAHYVHADSALDHEAYTRGNSVYFPDRVIPMLPERLSNGLCSLMPDQDRYCLAAHIWIHSTGEIKKYEFVRGLMRSRARLTYEQVEGTRQEAGGKSKEKSLVPNASSLMPNLWQAYAALAHERDTRGALDLNLPEYKIKFDEKGNVEAIAPKARLESHRLIETFMIAANVCAADFLLKHKQPAIFRVHEAPSDEKLEDLRNLLKMSGYGLAKGVLLAKHFNHVLHKSEKEPNSFMIHTAVLRSQMQAFYAAENTGHFGLALQKYCHFTSPIRRYADLVVHRALVSTMNDKRIKDDPIKKSIHPSSNHLSSVSLHISETERKAMMAERDASDRYKVSYMTRHIGSVFTGTVTGLNEYGLFVTLAENGVTGFIPVRNLRGDFFVYDKKHACFKGQRSKQQFKIGEPLMIAVQQANSLTGSLIFEIAAPTQTPFSGRPQQKNHGHVKFKNKKRR